VTTNPKDHTMNAKVIPLHDTRQAIAALGAILDGDQTATTQDMETAVTALTNARTSFPPHITDLIDTLFRDAQPGGDLDRALTSLEELADALNVPDSRNNDGDHVAAYLSHLAHAAAPSILQPRLFDFDAS
jgi:hypothetical protein